MDMHTLRSRHSELASMDDRRRVFGARSHGYRAHPASAAELDVLEERLGVALPAEYRTLLAELGSGTGPYYGLWSPEEVWREFGEWREDLADEGLCMSPARPWPLAEVPTPGEPAARMTFPCDGAICIGHQGCTFWTLLVTSGPMTGTVWDVACYVGFEGEYLLARRAPGVGLARSPLPELSRPPHLLEWYDAWLERCLADVPARDPRPEPRAGILRFISRWVGTPQGDRSE